MIDSITLYINQTDKEIPSTCTIDKIINDNSEPFVFCSILSKQLYALPQNIRKPVVDKIYQHMSTAFFKEYFQKHITQGFLNRHEYFLNLCPKPTKDYIRVGTLKIETKNTNNGSPVVNTKYIPIIKNLNPNELSSLLLIKAFFHLCIKSNKDMFFILTALLDDMINYWYTHGLPSSLFNINKGYFYAINQLKTGVKTHSHIEKYLTEEMTETLLEATESENP